MLLPTAVLAVSACPAILARAEKVTAPANSRLDEIRVTAKRRSDPVAGFCRCMGCMPNGRHQTSRCEMGWRCSLIYFFKYW
jgi:hypothetical protein